MECLPDYLLGCCAEGCLAFKLLFSFFRAVFSSVRVLITALSCVIMSLIRSRSVAICLGLTRIEERVEELLKF